ncbi:hypothetical protein D6C85_01491 [Aureobasidium pullulans]|uniref:Prion-inhibition and propagation HeLo domain-containing protein n=1 Tax=Aureobasidium pullulans TaxID=5580 RepID=A0A4S9XIP7_AURPU|nr:hypothetical protein D6C85_01491 [Aureobasidium pullulans]
MEAIGLALSAFGLPALFSIAIDSYRYIRLGKNFAIDFETSQTKLDLSRLQLSRWGEALGLPSLADTTQLPADIASEHDVEMAKMALGNIIELIREAETTSQRYEKIMTGDAVASLNPDSFELHRRFHEIISKRQRNTSLKKKTAWALYERDDLDRLVGHIIDLTNQLVNLFPATKQQQQELSVAELRSLGDESLPFVERIAASQDPVLASVAQKAMQARGSIYFQPTTTNGAAAHHGDFIHQDYQGPVGGLAHMYHKALAQGEGTRQHCGNVYGGSGRF